MRNVIAIGYRALHDLTDGEWLIAIGDGVALPPGSRRWASIPGVYEGPLVPSPLLEERWPVVVAACPAYPADPQPAYFEALEGWAAALVTLLPGEVSTDALAAAIRESVSHLRYATPTTLN